jgi:hypothetical protein
MTDTAVSGIEVTAMGPVDYLIVEFPPRVRTRGRRCRSWSISQIAEPSASSI